MANFKDIDRWSIWKILEDKIWHKIADKPLAASAEGWDEWSGSAKKKHPFLYSIFEDFPIKWHSAFKWTNDLYWQVQWRFNPKHQYNKITFAKPGYYDIDTRILFAACELTAQFVESQISHGHVAWDADPKHRNAWNIMQEVHKYWREEYPNREAEYPKYPQHLEGGSIFCIGKQKNWTEQQVVDHDFWINSYSLVEKKHLDRENEILQKIILIRSFMWD